VRIEKAIQCVSEYQPSASRNINPLRIETATQSVSEYQPSAYKKSNQVRLRTGASGPPEKKRAGIDTASRDVVQVRCGPIQQL
jgi:hypothetical protein